MMNGKSFGGRPQTDLNGCRLASQLIASRELPDDEDRLIESLCRWGATRVRAVL